KFYEECLKQLQKVMLDLRNCNGNSDADGWNNLPSLNDLVMDDFHPNTCLWDQDCLDLLTGLLQDESQEAVQMLGDLCEQMEKYESLRTQVSEHKQLMKQITTQVLTHQDQCLVRSGLVALDIIFRDQKTDFVKHALQTQPILAFVIGLLDCSSVVCILKLFFLLMYIYICAYVFDTYIYLFINFFFNVQFVMRRAVRLLSLLADQCECAWKLNESQKNLLIDYIPRVQHHLLETNSWSSIYATDTFITQDMFHSIAHHLKL
ncbi:hypothetical protein RFI_10978, partial [Reticulomyxa filosa]